MRQCRGIWRSARVATFLRIAVGCGINSPPKCSDISPVSGDARNIMKLEVPVIVVLGERKLSLAEVLSIAPGGIIEIPKSADAELELRVNNRIVGTGRAVKVGENFGIRISQISSRPAGCAAHAEASIAGESPSGTTDGGGLSAEALAEAMLAGQ